MALSMLGQHAQAADCAVAAQRELLALGNLRAAARVSQNLGGLQQLCDAYPESARHYREAAVLFARLGDHAHSVLADIGLAAALTSMGDFDEAERMHARARMRAGNQGLVMQLAPVDESQALVDMARGRYRAALAGLESARRRYEVLAVPQYLAIAEKQLADAYLELRLLPEAHRLFDAAVVRFSQLALPDEQAAALAQRGRTEALLGQPAADASFAQAAQRFATQGNAVGEATVALARAELALTGGQARAEVLRGQALLQAGRLAEAGAAFDAGLRSAQERQQLQLQVRCHTGQGLVAQALGDGAAAGTAFEAAITLFEDQRRALPANDIRRAFLTDHLRPYQERLRSALQQGDAAAVLQQLERLRARSLDERLDERLAEGSALALDADGLALRERLNWLYRHLQRLQDDGGSSALLTQELHDTEQALLERARRQRLASAPAPDGAAGAVLADGLNCADGALDLSALQAALRPGSDALVEYGVLDDELFACIVSAGRISLLRHAADWPSVLGALRSARFQMETLRHGSQPVQPHLAVLTRHIQARLARLHALVWAPPAAALDGFQRLLIVPHAQLGDLPFAALCDASLPDPAAHHPPAAASGRPASAANSLWCPAQVPPCVRWAGRPGRCGWRWRWANPHACRTPALRRSAWRRCSRRAAPWPVQPPHCRRCRRCRPLRPAPTCCTWPVMPSSAVTTRASRRCTSTTPRSPSTRPRHCRCRPAPWCSALARPAWPNWARATSWSAWCGPFWWPAQPGCWLASGRWTTP